MKHCAYCGAPLEDEAMFCGQCGEKADVTAPPAASNAEQLPQFREPLPVFEQPLPMMTNAPTFTEEPPKANGSKSAKFLKVVVIIALVFTAIALGALLVVGISGRDNPPPPQQAYAKAKIAIEKGDYETAYHILKENENEYTASLLQTLVYAPTEKVGSNGSKTVWTYDDDGNLTSMTVDRGSVQMEIAFVYDSDDRVVTESGKDGDYTYTRTYRYRNVRTPYESTYTDSDGNDLLTTYDYDGDGRLQKTVEVDRAFGGETVVEYAYDGDRLETITRCIDDGEPTVTTYAYAEDGKSMTVTDGSFTEEYTFDDSGYTKTMVFTDGVDGEVITYTYTREWHYHPYGVPYGVRDWIER